MVAAMVVVLVVIVVIIIRCHVPISDKECLENFSLSLDHVTKS